MNVKNENGIHLLEYLLSDEELREKYSLSILSMLVNPLCIIDKSLIQNKLHQQMIHFRLQDRQEFYSAIEKETFINRFDLNHKLLTEEISWLSYFLSSPLTYFLFLDAKIYNPDYKSGLSIVDKNGFNCWYNLCCYTVSTYMGPESKDTAHAIFSILKDDFPEGLLLKNKNNKTLYESVLKKCYLIDDNRKDELINIALDEQIRYTMNFLSYFKLNDQIAIHQKSKNKNKI